MPTPGMPATFASRAEYAQLVDVLRGTGVIDGPARLYWDARPSAKYSTIEIRVADVCTSVDDAVLVAALARALVATGIAAVEQGRPAPELRPELVRAASWRAARTGIDDVLIDLRSRHDAPARQVVQALVEHVADALDAAGDRSVVLDQLDVVFGRGTSARRQREVLGRHGSYDAVVEWLADETVR